VILIDEYQTVDDNGNKFWFKGNHYHRENGPAVEFSNGHKAWYLNGKFIATSEEKFMRLIKLKAFW